MVVTVLLTTAAAVATIVLVSVYEPSLMISMACLSEVTYERIHPKNKQKTIPQSMITPIEYTVKSSP